jgi:alkylated DNA repair protein (DNA oxidative demethylase)
MRSERLSTDLFESVPDVRPSQEPMTEGALLLRGLARPVEGVLIAAVRDIVKQAPFRRMMTPGAIRCRWR